MTTRRPLPIALWLPVLTVGAALFLVFVWPTPYRYETRSLGPDKSGRYATEYHRIDRLSGSLEYRTRPDEPWMKTGGESWPGVSWTEPSAPFNRARRVVHRIARSTENRP